MSLNPVIHLRAISPRFQCQVGFFCGAYGMTFHSALAGCGLIVFGWVLIDLGLWRAKGRPRAFGPFLKV